MPEPGVEWLNPVVWHKNVNLKCPEGANGAHKTIEKFVDLSNK